EVVWVAGGGGVSGGGGRGEGGRGERWGGGGGGGGPPVRAVAHVDVVLVVDCDGMWKVELSGTGAASAPRFHPVAILIVFCDAGIDVAVGDVDVPFGVPRDIGRLAEESIHRGQRWVRMFP